MSSAASTPANRLARETSPYLLQHAHNPVDWYPWGPEALERARAEDRPIFLSIGYSACHWCHVMERESFEDERIAEMLNRFFVCIKVDREERPDLDEIYMKAVQALNAGQGGWPMSVFLTPSLEPFFGGTYFPPTGRYGRPGFDQVVMGLAKFWTEDRESALKRGEALREMIAREGTQKTGSQLSPDVLDRSLGALTQSYDSSWGGFGSAPKFPHAMDIRILLRHAKRRGDPQALEMATVTLDRMAEGGIYDHLAGGFARYSTDERWLIPHFEKMLYDNALLVPAYLEAHLATGEERFARVARECCDWVLGEMVTPEGGFASTLDADSEGEEGKYYVWTPNELVDVLGTPHGVWAAAWFGVTDEGNFEHGKSALWRHQSAEAVAEELRVPLEELEAAMESARARLLEARAERVPPGKDDKVLAAWNGLMIGALAQAHQVLDEPRYLEAARAAARYVLEGMRQPDGRLFATARGGRAHLNAYLDDYVFLIAGLVDLYEADFDPHWLQEALALNEILTDRFEDREKGGYYTTGSDHEQLLARLKNPHDGALPSGNGLQALNLLRLAELTGDRELAARAERTITSQGLIVNQYPQAFSQLLQAVDFLAAAPREIVIAGRLEEEATREMLRTVRGRFLPQRVVALADGRTPADLVPLCEGREPPPSGARAYVCRDWTCELPVDSAGELAQQLD